MNFRILLFLYLNLCSIQAIATTLDSLEITNTKTTTTIIAIFSGTIQPHSFILNHPARIVVDCSRTNAGIDINSIVFKSSLITKIRSSYSKLKNLRLVFDLSHAVKIKTIIWKFNDSNNYGLQIKLLSPSHNLIQKSQVKTAAKITTKIQNTRTPPSRNTLIVIDPGHGGKDSGAIGHNLHKEKDIVLAIARKLQRSINQRTGMHAILTRNTDNYVGLRARLAMARRANADIFISIHADAFINRQSHGASIFALSPNGATSEAARWLAEKENYSELGGVDLSNLNDRNGLIRTVLLDLSQTATISASLAIGNILLNNMNKVTSLHRHTVEQARFIVLKSPDIPSVLIELGFITNPREEINLNNSTYQNNISQAIFAGLKQYLLEYPPQHIRIRHQS